MTMIWMLLLLMLITYGFIAQRRQDEIAIAYAMKECQRHQVQYLDCARSNHTFIKQNGAWRFRTIYLVDFSGDGHSRYQATMLMKGNRLAAFEMPAYKAPNVVFLH